MRPGTEEGFNAEEGETQIGTERNLKGREIINLEKLREIASRGRGPDEASNTF